MPTQPSVNFADIAAYYDDDLRRAISDYVYGNKRISSATARCLEFVRRNTRSVLEVGCGLGSTSAAIIRAHPNLAVLGVDISPKRVAAAERLFSGLGVSFAVADLSQPPEGAPFDLIVMVDVYEHIPPAARPAFHRSLAAVLADEGSLVLTCPSPLHQAHLRAHDPSGLQIVDEDVVLPDVLRLAADLQGEVVLFEYVSIWRTNDYLHAAITRNPGYFAIEPKAAQPTRGLWSRITSAFSRRLGWKTDPQMARRKEVAERLGEYLS